MNDDRAFRMTKGLPDEDLIQLEDLTFDFEDYFARHGTEAMSQEEAEEFQARIYGMFCRDVYASDTGGQMITVPAWTAVYIANKLIQALGGVEWEEIMGLPWDDTSKYFYYNDTGLRALAIYSAVESQRNAEEKKGITSALAEQAGKHNVSYETARSDYYDMKKALTKKGPMPNKFLTRDYHS
jgi:hypothetical protein